MTKKPMKEYKDQAAVKPRTKQDDINFLTQLLNELKEINRRNNPIMDKIRSHPDFAKSRALSPPPIDINDELMN